MALANILLEATWDCLGVDAYITKTEECYVTKEREKPVK
jgi:hypothetical protein